MNQKRILIGVGVLAAAGLVYYLWKKNESKEPEEKKASATGLGAIGVSKGVGTERLRWPRWLKLGGCRPCVGTLSDGCCTGCVCTPRL